MNVKKRLLEILEANKGQALSGVRLAEALDVSRNAVWKAIEALRKDGYRITAIINKGYCLTAENDMLSAEGIRPFLVRPEQVPVLTVCASLASTNQTAKALAVNDAAHGTVVASDCQTEGKGRYGRAFFSPAGSGLYMSLIWRPDDLNETRPELLTAYAAVCVCEAIEAVTEKMPSIKWVNDIFLDGKKIGGILTEAMTDFESRRLQWVVLGVGLNVTEPAGGFPQELQGTAGSVYGGAEANRNRLAAEIINRLLREEGLPNAVQVYEAYRKRLFAIGETVIVKESGAEYNAVALDVDEAGRLVLQKADGERHVLAVGEISVYI